jgi:hypothetical protein
MYRAALWVASLAICVVGGVVAGAIMAVVFLAFLCSVAWDCMSGDNV